MGDKFARFEDFKAIQFQVAVFWVVMSCNDVGGYQRFERSCCLYLQGEVKTEAAVLRNPEYCDFRHKSVSFIV
jgi:hypothetical protein